jgi:predicted nuclease of restriction endonuclease-like (RecB) superfamily
MLLNDNQYLSVVEEIKNKIQSARYKATVAVNSELVLLYHSIGQTINEHKAWGNKFIDNLAKDIALAYPEAKGYSVRNLKYMAKFAAEFTDIQFVQQAVAQIPWGHIIVLLDSVPLDEQRRWYILNTIENGCSRSVLVHQIESKLYERQVIAEKVSNFDCRLPTPQSELAVQTMKDPYVFDFVPFSRDMAERDIENALVKDVTAFLLELGTGFAFLGHQYHLNVGGDDFYIDLLFYNINLRCYVVIELKNEKFKPEHAGQLSFYISAVDGELKKEGDNPTIGLLLCKSKNNLVAEYALQDVNKPMGISEYRLGELPEEYKNLLPSIEDIQKRIK